VRPRHYAQTDEGNKQLTNLRKKLTIHEQKFHERFTDSEYEKLIEFLSRIYSPEKQ